MPDIKPLSFVEISKENLIHNVKLFKSLAKKGTKFSVAIKGNAYGHGQNEMARILEAYVDYFQINSLEELELLRKVSSKPAFLFGYVEMSALQKAVKLGCILSIFSIEQLRALDRAAGKLRVKQEIHIPVDAYLGREGFLLNDLPGVFKALKKCKNIKVSGIYAHFANMEDVSVGNFFHAKKQIDEYERAVKVANEFGFKNLETHISATSGLLAYEKNRGVHPVIRLGIGAYGMWPSRGLREASENSKFKLKPVLSWKTKIAQIKILGRGSTVGYGLTFKVKKKTKIAVIFVGYADGLDRGLSNKGEVLVGGTRCNILGRVSMNMTVVDVNHLDTVRIEDEVVILGRQTHKKKKVEISAEEMADFLGTINYEVTARISSLLARVVN